MFLAVCGGVAVVVWWAVRNDGAGPEDATTGLLRMAGGADDPSPDAPPAGGRPRGRGPLHPANAVSVTDRPMLKG